MKILHLLSTGWIIVKVQTKMSLLNIVTSPGYKCPTCNYRCRPTSVKDGKYQIKLDFYKSQTCTFMYVQNTSHTSLTKTLSIPSEKLHWSVTIFHFLMKRNSKCCQDIKLSAKLISKWDSFSTLKIQGNFEKSFVHLLKLIGPCLEHKTRWNRACSSGKTTTLSIYSLSFYVKADKRGTKTIILCSLTS